VAIIAVSLILAVLLVLCRRRAPCGMIEPSKKLTFRQRLPKEKATAGHEGGLEDE